MNRSRAAADLLQCSIRYRAAGADLIAVKGDGGKAAAKRERGQDLIDHADWLVVRASGELFRGQQEDRLARAQVTHTHRG